MADPNPFSDRLREPLNETTRRTRRNLLAAATVGVVITKVGLVPSKISAFGIGFSQANQKSLLILLIFVIVYFLVTFITYVSSELVAWQIAFRSDELKKLKNADDDYDVWSSDKKEMYIMERARKTYRMARPTFYLRIFIELIVPILFSIYAAIILWNTQISNDKTVFQNGQTYNGQVLSKTDQEK